jgi:hypothetical protein
MTNTRLRVSGAHIKLDPLQGLRRFSTGVTAVGIQAGTGYLMVSPVPSGGCNYNTLYIGGISGNAGNAATYATVLAAMENGQQVTVVQYINTSGTCVVGQVQVGS